MKYELIVTASMEDSSEKTVMYDVNDNDISMVRRVANVLSKQQDYNWCPSHYLCDGIDPDDYVKKDLLSSDDIKSFNEFVPHGGNYFCVNINSIVLSPVVEKETIL